MTHIQHNDEIQETTVEETLDERRKLAHTISKNGMGDVLALSREQVADLSEQHLSLINKLEQERKLIISQDEYNIAKDLALQDILNIEKHTDDEYVVIAKHDHVVVRLM